MYEIGTLEIIKMYENHLYEMGIFNIIWVDVKNKNAIRKGNGTLKMLFW